MTVLVDIFYFCCNALCVLALLCASIAFLDGFVMWAANHQPPPSRSQRKKKTAFSGEGRSLGGASAVDRNAARQARIKSNRVSTQFSNAREAMKQRQSKVQQAQDLSLARRGESSSSPPPSPSSVLQLDLPVATLPQELRPESTNHFFMEGATKFIVVPNLLCANDAVAVLRRISREFMPIIRKRGFAIRSVSEMCCCADGLEYELGGERRSVAAGEVIVGNDHDTVAGYNGKVVNRFGGCAEYVIHLRLRDPGNHKKFMDYEEIVDTMAHELAHCVHEDHGPEFWALMEDILNDRAKIVEDLKSGAGTFAECNPVEHSKEEFGGFDIYQSATGQMRNWNNGRVMVRAE